MGSCFSVLKKETSTDRAVDDIMSHIHKHEADSTQLESYSTYIENITDLFTEIEQMGKGASSRVLKVKRFIYFLWLIFQRIPIQNPTIFSVFFFCIFCCDLPPSIWWLKISKQTTKQNQTNHTKYSKDTGFLYAMKEMCRDDPWNPLLFEKEVNILRTITMHPNIINHVRAYHTNTHFYIINELATGTYFFLCVFVCVCVCVYLSVCVCAFVSKQAMWKTKQRSTGFLCFLSQFFEGIENSTHKRSKNTTKKNHKT